MINRGLLFAIAIGFDLVSCHNVKAQIPKSYRLVTPSPTTNLQDKPKNSRNSFEPPPEEKAPKQTTGGGSRNGSNCSLNSPSRLPLTAIVPSNGLGLTSKARPSLPVYIPMTTAQNLELSLFDANHRGIYQTNIRVPATGKVVRIALPPAAPDLEVQQEYYWTIAMICDPSDRLKDRVVTGKIKRIQLNNPRLQQNLKLTAAQPLRQINLYRQAGLWYEMMSTLLIHQQNDPFNSQIQLMWRNLFASSGLEHFAIPNN